MTNPSSKIKISFLLSVLVFFYAGSLFAATVEISSPAHALANRQPLLVEIYLDTKGEVVSGISGNFSFPENLFSVENITIKNSPVSIWVQSPNISQERYLDSRTHITFEGIFPGGFDGVRSPYVDGKKNGILFSVTLVPKSDGKGVFLLDDITLLEFSSDANPLQVESASTFITVPRLDPEKKNEHNEHVFNLKPTLGAMLTNDLLDAENTWYMTLYDKEENSSRERIYVAETDDTSPFDVRVNAWKSATVPYVLKYQDRSKFLHVKVLYFNKTYSVVTIPPVENSHSISSLSRILVSIIIVLSLLYIYGKNITALIFKKNQ